MATNAKKELLELNSGVSTKMICATIHRVVNGMKSTSLDLRVGYTQVELEKFIDGLDFEYYAGYGSQELYGMVWYEDGTWAGRKEYDGAEWWSHHKCPEIPANLK